MKKLLIFTFATLLLISCETPGTTYNPDQGNHPKYNIEKYYYGENSNEYVMIVTRKDSLPVTNVTWSVKSGKTHHNVSSVIDDNERPVKVINDSLFVYRKKDILMQNDSIVVIRK